MLVAVGRIVFRAWRLTRFVVVTFIQLSRSPINLPRIICRQNGFVANPSIHEWQKILFFVEIIAVLKQCPTNKGSINDYICFYDDF